MSTASKESKVYLFASFIMAFVGVPVIAAHNLSPENIHLAIGGSLGLMVSAAILLLAGISRLQKEGAIYFPDRPRIPAVAVLLVALTGAAIGFAVIHFAGLLGNVTLMLWVFLLCSGAGGLAGLYMAGLRLK